MRNSDNRQCLTCGHKFYEPTGLRGIVDNIKKYIVLSPLPTIPNIYHIMNNTPCCPVCGSKKISKNK